VVARPIRSALSSRTSASAPSIAVPSTDSSRSPGDGGDADINQALRLDADIEKK
jgi:hypothetical protein